MNDNDIKKEPTKGIFDDDTPPISSLPKAPLTEEQILAQSRKKSIISLVFGLIPVALFIYCLIESGGDTSEGGDGAIWWLMIIYYWSLGIPIAIGAVAFAIKATSLKKHILSIISVIVAFLPAAFVGFLLLSSMIFEMFPGSYDKLYKLFDYKTSYSIASDVDPNLIIEFPRVSEERYNCSNYDSRIYCYEVKDIYNSISAEPETRVTYKYRAQAIYDAYKIDGVMREINCIENSICYVLDYNIPKNGVKQELFIITKGSTDDDIFKINYTFTIKNSDEYLEDIINKVKIKNK